MGPFTLDIWERIVKLGKLGQQDRASLSATCKGMRTLLLPRRIRCSKAASVAQLAAAARRWDHAEQIQLPLQGLVIGAEDTCALNSILGRALKLPRLRRLQLLQDTEHDADGHSRFDIILRNRLLEAPSLQVLHLHAAHVQALPRQAFMQLRELKLEVEEPLPQGVCAALCQASSLQMLFLTYKVTPRSHESKKNLAIGSFDLRSLQNLKMAGLSRLGPVEYKLPPHCRYIGTLQQPVVVQLPGLEVLRLVAKDTLHVSLQGALPRVLELSVAYVPLGAYQYEDELDVGPGLFSLHVGGVAALANNLQEMEIVYRTLQGDAHDLMALLELLALRQADVHCGAFQHHASTWKDEWQVEYNFTVERSSWEGLSRPLECSCRACRWGSLANGPFQEYTYHAEVRRNGRRRSTFIDFNNMDELRRALVARGGVIVPDFQLPTD